MVGSLKVWSNDMNSWIKNSSSTPNERLQKGEVSTCKFSTSWVDKQDGVHTTNNIGVTTQWRTLPDLYEGWNVQNVLEQQVQELLRI